MEELQDKIGREKIVKKIVGLVDALPEGKQFCLALDGQWGSGKSFILGMINESLSEHKEYLIVKYDAWKNNFYPDPLIAILYCILDSVKDRIGDIKQYDRVVKKALKRLSKGKVKDKVDSVFKSMYDKGGWIAVGAFAIEFLCHIIKIAKESILDNKIFEEYKSYQALLSDSVALLNALTSYEEYDGKQTKLVVLVDEIDRCLPDEQLKVLERLHHLLQVNNCAVIVALNKEQIEEAYKNHYGGNGKEYLRKFFDYDFHLDTNASILFANWLWDEIVENDDIEKVQPISNDEILLIQQVVFNIVYDKYGAKRTIDNRTISRILHHIKYIVERLPEKKIDYPYIYLIGYLLSSKLYDKNTFDKFHRRKEPLYPDIVANREIQNELTKVVGSISLLAGKHHNIYLDSNLNTVNYYINSWIAHGDLQKEDGVKRLFMNNVHSADPDCVKKVDIIFKLIDSISD